jgi:hypothetical protein
MAGGSSLQNKIQRNYSPIKDDKDDADLFLLVFICVIFDLPE